MDLPAFKTCPECDVSKPYTLDYFYRESGRKSGLASRCKHCTKIRNQKFKEKNPDYAKRKGKERYNPELNPARYKKYQKEYLERRQKELKTARGRLVGLLSAAKKRASKKNLPFELSITWALDLYERQDGTCALTCIPFTLDFTPGGRKYHPFNPSLDRIDSTKGYTVDNTRLVCTAINIALNDFGDDVFTKVCKGYIAALASSEVSVLTPSVCPPTMPQVNLR